MIPLTGKYGTGKYLRVSTIDLPDLLDFTENGKRLFAVNAGNGYIKIQIKGAKAQAWARSKNPNHLITAARFLIGESNHGRRVHFKDGNSFNLTRSNIEVEIPAIKKTFPIDWGKAITSRQTKMAKCDFSNPTIH